MVTLGLHDSMEEFLGQYPTDYCTYCQGNPLGWLSSNHTFDYIYFSNIGFAKTSLKTVEGAINMKGTKKAPWSDHFGVRVEFSVEPTIAETSLDVVESRRAEALVVLNEALEVLKHEDSVEYHNYIVMIEDLSSQLKKPPR